MNSVYRRNWGFELLVISLHVWMLLFITWALTCVATGTARADDQTVKQRLFERAFGDAVILDPEIVGRVKSLKPGKRLHIDHNGDGKNDEVWYIDVSSRHTSDARPILVRVLDEDGDLDDDHGPDLDSDLYIADWHADGQVDAVIDYEDNDGDDDLDEMGIYYYSPSYRFLDNKPALLVWWGRDIGDDNLLWYDMDLTYSQPRCQYRCHFSGDEVFLNFGLAEDSNEWQSIFENPFAFFDPDGDTCSEVVVRLSGRGDKVEALRYSLDADDDAYGEQTHDYDFSITAVAAGRYLPAGVTGRVVRYPTEITEGIRLRGIPTETWAQWENVRRFAQNARWARVLLTWDEINANTEAQVDRDPHERWEGIINHGSEHFLQVGGPPTSKFNKRNELSISPQPPLRLYYDRSDRRLHLKGANEGWLHVDFNLDGKVDAKYMYTDEDADGFLDRRQIDVDADGIVDFDWPMRPDREFALEFETLSRFYRPELFAVLEDSQKFIDAAKAALTTKQSAPLVNAVETYFLIKLGSWCPATKLGERVRATPAGARLYVDLLRDRLLAALQTEYGTDRNWPKVVSPYASGDYEAAARAVMQELAPTAKPIQTKAFGEFNRRIPLSIDNSKGPERSNWPICVPIQAIRTSAPDFNTANCAVVAPHRWIDWRQIPHQIDRIDPAVGDEISFLVDVLAGEAVTYYLYYRPNGISKPDFKPATYTAEDWIPPNIGWESEKVAYRTYWGQFDFFGKKVSRLIYPTIGAASYHGETEWGIDALHVGETSGLGGLTLYVDGKLRPVQNPAGKGNVKFKKRMLTHGPVRAAVEIVASNIVPDEPDRSVRLLCVIYADHQETEIRLSSSKSGDGELVGIGLSKLGWEKLRYERYAGFLGSWGFQDDSIGEVGLGLIVAPDRIEDIADLPNERHLRCDLSNGRLRYWIIGDWRRGRQYPVAPTIDNWRRELACRAERLLNDVKVSIGSCERIAHSPAEGKQQQRDRITAESIKAFAQLEAQQPGESWIRNSTGSGLAWAESYRLMAYVSMYEATRNAEHLNKAMHRLNEVLSARDDNRRLKDEFRGKVLPAWSSTKYTKGKRYCWIVHAGMLTYPMARFAYLVKRDPALQREFGEAANVYARAVEQTVRTFEHAWREGPGENEGHYHGVYTGESLPLNMQNALGRTLVTLWLITGKAEYKQKAEKLVNFFKNQIHQAHDRYVWPYMPYSNKAEDISHAGINVDFAFVCYRAQIGFTKEELLGFCRTLKFCSRGADGFTKRVDGEGDFSYSAQMGRWGHLAYVEPELRDNLYGYFKEDWPKDSIAGMIAAAHLAETQKELTFDTPLATE